MNSSKLLLPVLLASISSCVAAAQEIKPAPPAASPPNLLRMVYRDLPAGREAELRKLQSTLARKCDALNFPDIWIELRSLTGSAESLHLGPLDSFEQWQESQTDWRRLNSSHPQLARIQEDIDGLAGFGRTTIAFRRDDLSHLLEFIDLSEVRFFRLSEVRLFPGHEPDFAEATRLLADARLRTDADFPWVVYQVLMGGAVPTFLILSPMPELKQNDDLPEFQLGMMVTAEDDQTHDRLMQIAKESFAGVETRLFAVDADTSHVSPQFAFGNAGFWRPAVEAAESDSGAQSRQTHPKKKETNPARTPTGRPE